jgi:hypothetical protein
MFPRRRAGTQYLLRGMRATPGEGLWSRGARRSWESSTGPSLRIRRGCRGPQCRLTKSRHPTCRSRRGRLARRRLVRPAPTSPGCGMSPRSAATRGRRAAPSGCRCVRRRGPPRPGLWRPALACASGPRYTRHLRPPGREPLACEQEPALCTSVLPPAVQRGWAFDLRSPLGLRADLPHGADPWPVREGVPLWFRSGV